MHFKNVFHCLRIQFYKADCNFIAGNAPLARTTSMSSCAGYHTPIEDEVAGDGISDLPSDLGLLTSRGGSFLHTQVENILMHFICCFGAIGNLMKIRLWILGTVTKLSNNDRVTIVGRIFGTNSFIIWITTGI